MKVISQSVALSLLFIFVGIACEPTNKSRKAEEVVNTPLTDDQLNTLFKRAVKVQAVGKPIEIGSGPGFRITTQKNILTFKKELGIDPIYAEIHCTGTCNGPCSVGGCEPSGKICTATVCGDKPDLCQPSCGKTASSVAPSPSLHRLLGDLKQGGSIDPIKKPAP